jgi:hypothetical protein
MNRTNIAVAGGAADAYSDAAKESPMKRAKRLLAAVMLATAVAATSPVIGHAQQVAEQSDLDQYEDAFSNPLRLAYYVVYPVGFTMEWLVMRPFHYLVSRPYLNHFFGYTPIGEEGTYERMGEHM